MCAAAACMAALVVAGAGETRRAVRMTDESMEILMTPHFVPALEQATATGRSQMLSQQQAAQQKATLDALTMTHSTTHILPKNLRQQYAISCTKSHLGAVNNLSPQQAAMRVSPMGDSAQSLRQAAPDATGGNPATASTADSAFLGAEPAPQLTAQQHSYADLTTVCLSNIVNNNKVCRHRSKFLNLV